MPYTKEQRKLEENILYHAREETYHKSAKRRYEKIRDAQPTETVAAVEAYCIKMAPSKEKAVADIAAQEAAMDQEAADEAAAKEQRAEERDAEAQRDAQ